MSIVRSGLVLAGGVATAAAFTVYGESWLDHSAGLLTGLLLFLWLLVTMGTCAFTAIEHADELAERMGEPFGTLLLTLSVVTIEVVLIAMIMSTGETNPTLARDTMFSVLMIVLNAMVGTSLLVGGLAHGRQEYNLEGARSYLSVILPLAVIPLILPRFTVSTADASLSAPQSIAFALFTVLLYGVFLALQTMRHRSFFEDPVHPDAHQPEPDHPAPHGKGSTLTHLAFLVMLLVPFVVMAEELANYVDYGIAVLGAPATIGGILIASLVLLPEAVSAFKSARANRLQRSVNICLGSALSTIGLTIPTVLLIGLLTGHPIILGLDDSDIVLLATTLFLSVLTFSGGRTNVLLGLVHIVMFAVFLVLAVNP
ncbi:calcium:proton antiporter [Tropicimonas sp. IMCC34043]|uniref:calcium:proton antiporter n=1 Tax=Tropicimonas sp. IMCC34043 TaxID=2248760 RepID=UPI000E24E477|nr:calcium:proton antiporter [Tropicimonas sp. IMCC34043]